LLEQRFNWQDFIWISFALVLSMVQIAATLADRNIWPISAYNVFNFRPGPRFFDLEVALSDSNGRRYLAHPGQSMPLDFFRVNAILQDRFVVEQDPTIQFKISKLILKTLNTRSWRGWDERYPAVSIQTGSRFRQFEVILVEHDTEAHRIVRRTILYTYVSMP
jgi:hypothetical protein